MTSYLVPGDDCWRAPEAWPFDMEGGHRVLLPRAVLAIGAAKFKGDWSDKDPLAFMRAEPTTDHSVFSELLLDQISRGERLSRGGWTNPASVGLKPSAEQREQAWTSIRSHNLKAAAGIERMTSVCRELAQASEAGTLKSFCLFGLTGDLYPVPPAWWRTQYWMARFRTGRVNHSDPLGAGIGRFPCWLYFDRDGLEAISASYAAKPEFSVSLWCTDPANEAAARAALQAEGETPSEAAICKWLTSTWHGMGFVCAAGTIKALRRRHRAGG